MKAKFTYWTYTLTLPLILVSGCSENESTSDHSSKWQFLTEFRELVLENSIYADSVNQRKFETVIAGEASGCQSAWEYHQLARHILTDMGDQHSDLISPMTIALLTDSTDQIESFPDNINFTLNNQFENIPILTLRGIMHETNEDILQYADSLNVLIKQFDISTNKGWIIDLRENDGGDFSSMFLGMAPFIGNDTTIFYLHRDGQKESVFIKDGFMFHDTSRSILPIKSYELAQPDKPVAVLIGPNTCSAGEFIAVALRAHSNVKLFGMESAGLTTTMSLFQLKNGAILNLSSAVLVDRNGRRYGGKIHPDFYIKYNPKDNETSRDSVLSKAIQWILNY